MSAPLIPITKVRLATKSNKVLRAYLNDNIIRAVKNTAQLRTAYAVLPQSVKNTPTSITGTKEQHPHSGQPDLV